MDPLTGKSISLLKLSPAEEDLVWVYENFSYSCELPACHPSTKCLSHLPQGLRTVCWDAPAVKQPARLADVGNKALINT